MQEKSSPSKNDGKSANSVKNSERRFPTGPPQRFSSSQISLVCQSSEMDGKPLLVLSVWTRKAIVTIKVAILGQSKNRKAAQSAHDEELRS
jgi:hypothetical protein